MHPGTQQNQRLARALQAGYISPDELTLAQRLRLLLLAARRLAFVDAQGQPAGDWGAVLGRDPALLLAELAAFPIERVERELLAELARLDGAGQWQRCLELLLQLDRWCHAIDALDDGQALPGELARSLQARLQGELAPLLDRLITQRQGPARELPPGLHRHWRLSAAAPSSVTQEGAPLGEATPASLRLLAMALCRAARQLGELAAQALPQSLASGRHEPAMGLLLAWMQLLQHSRTPLNRFAERLSDDYYLERLGLHPQPPRGDLIHVLLQRDPRHAGGIEIPAGSRLVCARDASGRTRGYRTEQPLELGSLQVAALLSQRLESDPLISPEHEFGYASAARATRITPPSPEAAARPRAQSWPLLGGGNASQADDAELGLAIASPLLMLAEGEREIELSLRLTQPAGPDAQLKPLLQQCQRCVALPPPLRAEALRPLLGRLFAVWLCQSREDFEPSDLQALQTLARRSFADAPANGLPSDDPLSLIYGQRQGLPPERELLLDRVFRGLWQCRLSTPGGWLSVEAVHTRSSTAIDGSRSLHIVLRLGAGQAAVVPCSAEVHGPAWAQQPALPVLQLRLRGRGRVFGVSLLQQLRLEQIGLRVKAQGLRQLQLHNQLGRLDAGKPFLPFGPLPDSSSYLLFGSSELAAKPLQALSLRLHWAGLPPQGLAAAYSGYPEGPWSRERFRVSASVLGDGRWREAGDQGLALFGSGEAVEEAEQTLTFQASRLAELHRGGAPGPLADYGTAARRGFFKLQLAEPAAAFGHALYPRLLTEVLSRNARSKRPEALPAPPYTPTLEQISLSYESSEQLALSSDRGRAGSGPQHTRLWRIEPFGLLPWQAELQGSPLLRPWAAAGQLFIGLAGSAPQGLLNLLFQLDSSAAQEAFGQPLPSLQWAAWCGESGWVTLEAHRILQDQTLGMLRTGLVVLDLPAGLARGCPAMPDDLFWLRLSANGDLTRLAPLQGLWTQAVCARAEPAESAAALAESATPLAPGSVKTLDPPVPGVIALSQPLPGFALREAEDLPALRRRAAERLRHRQRAITPWDFERLVLEAFPEVFKIKCMPQRPRGECPGRVLVVVVPALPPGFDIDGTEAPRLDAATLQRIADFLAERSAPSLQMVVRNASYERIQVRCVLRLARDARAGERLRLLNQALRDFLSPWREGGIGASFDWRIGTDEVEAMLRAQDGVEAVGQVSLLHIVRSDSGFYRLYDSARSRRAGPLRPAHRWSLALPMRRHLIELDEQPGARGPQPTGLPRLALGSSFVIGGART